MVLDQLSPIPPVPTAGGVPAFAAIPCCQLTAFPLWTTYQKISQKHYYLSDGASLCRKNIVSAPPVWRNRLSLWISFEQERFLPDS